MGFSAHEMIIFLRVRDEASRMLGRFSRNTQRVNQELIAGNDRIINDNARMRGDLQNTLNKQLYVSKAKIAASKKEIS